MNQHDLSKPILITGITGSGGSYLAEFISENHPDISIHGTSRWHSTTNEDNLAAIRNSISIHETDLVDFGSILRVIQDVRPGVIFHLAAHANVRASFETPASVLNNNIIGTSNLLEAVRLSNIDPIIQMCSSSEVYGQVRPEDVPITEDAPMRPSSPYAVSKTAQDLLGWTYFVSYGMRIIRTRMFSYLNPRRKDLFATSFADQIAKIELGHKKELTHGNLESVRTLIDVRDAMRAYWMAISHCEPGEVYNIGGSSTMKVGEFLDRLTTLSKVPIPTRIDASLFRPADVTLQIPCTEKFMNATGWQPIIDFDDSMQNLLDYCRNHQTSMP